MKKKLIKKNKKKRGFTLIELLAVILILGIIALIAIPTVSNVVEQSRRGAFESSTRNLIKAVEEGCMVAKLSDTIYPEYIRIINGEADYELDIKGSLPDEASIYVENSCDVSLKAHSGNYMFIKNKDDDDANLDVLDYEENNYILDRAWEYINYIESNGKQYIDTGITASTNLKVVLDFVPYEAKDNPTSIQFFYGSRQKYDAPGFSLLTQNPTSYRVDYATKSTSISYTIIEYGKRYKAIHDKVSVKIYDESNELKKTSSFNVDTSFDNGFNMYVFAINQNGVPYANYYASMKFYSMQIYDNDVLLRDYVPVVLKNGNGALLDKVNNQVYENKGTEKFLIG